MSTKTTSPSEEEVQEQPSQLQKIASTINKKYGTGSVFLFSDKPKVDPELFIQIGHYGIDNALGNGIPLGKIIEFYGPESSGKTSVALAYVAAAQKRGKLCAIVDAEHALERSTVEMMGVDVDKLIISQPASGEEALDIVEMLATSGVSLVIVDSVAALTPLAELEGSMTDQQMGAQARMMGKGLRKLTGLCNTNHCAVIFINQIRQKIGVMFGSPETTSGGQSLKFFASIRLDIRKIEQISKTSENDKEKQLIGQRSRIKVVKNKVFPPFQEAIFDLYFMGVVEPYGIIKEQSYLTEAEKYGIIVKSGAWFSYNGENFAQGMDNAIKCLITDPEFSEEVRQKIMAAKQSGELPNVFNKEKKSTSKKKS